MKKAYIVLLCLLFAGCAGLQKKPVDIFEEAEEAGTKISELGEHTDFVDDNDLYVIVDSSANTTRKIKPHWQSAYDIQARDGGQIYMSDGGKIITNRGYATNPVTYTLPECRADPSCANDPANCSEVGDGWWVVFYTINPYVIRVDPDPDDTIEDFASGTPEIGDWIALDGVVGSAVKCVCQNGPDPNTHGATADTYVFYTMGYVGTVSTFD